MKAQSTTEFLSVLPLVFVLFGVFAILFFYHTSILRQTQERLHARSIAQDAAVALDTIYMAGDGASLNYTLPFTGYNTSVRNGVVETRTPSGEIVQFLLLTDNTTNVSLLPTVVQIQNQGGFLAIG